METEIKNRLYSSSQEDVAYVVELHVKHSTDVLSRVIERESKIHNSEMHKVLRGQEALVNAIETVSSVTTQLKNDVVETKSAVLDEKIGTKVNQLIEGHDAIVGRVNDFAEAQDEMKEVVINQMPKFVQKADRYEHISFQLRGQLGSQERKRRKVDLEEIGRLRHEIGVLKRQNRDKDVVVKAMGDRVKSLVDQMAEM